MIFDRSFWILVIINIIFWVFVYIFRKKISAFIRYIRNHRTKKRLVKLFNEDPFESEEYEDDKISRINTPEDYKKEIYRAVIDELIKIQNARPKLIRWIRNLFIIIFFVLIAIILFNKNSIIIFGKQFKLYVSDNVLIAIVSTLIVNLIGLLLVIFRYMFSPIAVLLEHSKNLINDDTHGKIVQNLQKSPDGYNTNTVLKQSK